MMKLAYLVGVHCALAKLGTSAKGNFRATNQEELSEYIRDAYRNDKPSETLAGLGTPPTTNTTSLSKQGLYTQWSKEEPRLRQITSEEQTGGQLEPSGTAMVEPSSTASPSQPRPLPLLGQLRPGIDMAGSGWDQRG